MCGTSYSCHNTGAFLMGTPSSRQIKRTAHKAARRVNEAIDHLADAMDM